MTRTVFVFTALLLAAGTAAARQQPGSEPGTRLWNIQFEALRIGGGGAVVTERLFNRPAYSHPDGWVEERLLSLSVGYSKFRAGTSLFVGLMGLGLADASGNPNSSVLPIKVGYTLWQRPVRYSRTGTFQGMFPDVSAEAELYWLNGFLDGPTPVSGKAGICAEVDRFGLGAGAELAVFYNIESYRGLHAVVPSASLYLRLVTNLGF